jgi:hypothetical protein
MTDQLAALIRGELLEGLQAGSRWESLRDAAEHHAVLPLVADRLLSAAGASTTLAAGLADRVRRAAVAEAVREPELASLLEAFGRASVGALLFKGAALAYTCYGRPELRPRTDTDLLIPEAQRTAAEAVLCECGYEPSGHFSGDLVAYQAAYLKRRQQAVVHVVDLHWRLSNPQPFGDVLTYEDAAAEAVPVVELGPHARTRPAGAGRRRRADAFLRPRRHAAIVAQDLATMPTWGSRVRLLRKHAFPPAAYMRDVYAPSSRLPLPILYLRRAWHGARKWLGGA